MEIKKTTDHSTTDAWKPIMHVPNAFGNLKRFVLALSVFATGASTAGAATTAHFPFGQPRAMITVQSPSVGPSDEDANILFAAMNVPIQDSFAGRGKSIQFGKNIFTQVCAIRSEVYTCTFLIQSSANSRVDSIREIAEIALTGEDANQLSKLFVPNQGSEFAFEAVDGKLKILARAGEFRVRFTGK